MPRRDARPAVLVPAPGCGAAIARRPRRLVRQDRIVRPDALAAAAPDSGRTRCRTAPRPGCSTGWRVARRGRTNLTIAAEQPERFHRIVATGVGANLSRNAPSDLIAKAIRGQGDTENPASQYFAGLARLPGNDPDALIACMSSPRPRLDD